MKDFSNYSLLKHNTFGIAADCKRFLEYESVDELRALLPHLRTEPNLLHIGAGSNLLFTRDYDGIVLHSAIRGMTIHPAATGDEVLVTVGAGETWDEFVNTCVQSGYYGLENLSLIPGEVGASAVQNIGAYGVEVAQRIVAVYTINLLTGVERRFTTEECCYVYRSSVFKQELKGQYVVTHVTFRLSTTFVPILDYAGLVRELAARGVTDVGTLTAVRLREIIMDVRQQKLPDPAVIGSAGSFFMNPVVDEAHFRVLRQRFPQLPFYPVSGGSVKIPAGWLIQEAGWKGRQLGAAGVWSKQALVLINMGGASGADIAALSRRIQDDVWTRFGIRLHPEVNFI